MLALFMAGAFWFKMPVGIAMILASIGGTLAAGEGVPVRHLFEGSMGFLDTMLVVATAMIFMKVVEATGALEHIGRVIVRVFAGRPAFWGPFDTPYTDHDEGYYWEKYNGWYNIRELGLSGGVGQVAVKLDYLRYDDLINIQKKVKTEAAVPLGSSTVFRHKLDFDQGAKKLISNELILEGTASLPGLLRNVGWSVLWDTVAKTDSLVVSASYTAPNRITFELEHKKDSGAKLTISSQMTF